MKKRILLIDCMGGPLGRYTTDQLAKRFPGGLRPEAVRAHGRPDWAGVLDAIRGGGVAGIMVTGSKAYVNDPTPWILDVTGFCRELLDLDTAPPTLGICFGHQLFAIASGGVVESRPPHRRGMVTIERVEEAPSPLDMLPTRFRGVVSHRDHVASVGPSLRVIASADYTSVQALSHVRLPITSVQCHPEYDRPLMHEDQRIHGHSNWEHAVTDAALQSCEAPAILDRFAAQCAGATP